MVGTFETNKRLDDDPEIVSRRSTIMVRLLSACCKYLGDRGMTGVFIDGIKSEESGLVSLGKLIALTLRNYYFDDY